MSKPRIAAWIAGTALLLSSGVALADNMPADPALLGDDTEESVEVEGVVEEEGVEEEADDADDVEVESVDVEDADAEDDDADDGEQADAARVEDGEENHGTVVSEAAHNHEFDEACGNHGAYVSEVAHGGDPADPECAKEEVVGGEQSTATVEGDDSENDEAKAAKNKKATQREARSGAKGKGKSGK